MPALPGQVQQLFEACQSWLLGNDGLCAWQLELQLGCNVLLKCVDAARGNRLYAGQRDKGGADEVEEDADGAAVGEQPTATSQRVTVAARLRAPRLGTCLTALITSHHITSR